jgi:hypothetical protein
MISVTTIEAMRPVSCRPVSPCLRWPARSWRATTPCAGSGVFPLVAADGPGEGGDRGDPAARGYRVEALARPPGRWPVRPRSGRLTRGSFARWAWRSSSAELGSPRGWGVFPEIADRPEHDRWAGPPASQEGCLPHRRTTLLPAQSSRSLLPRRALAAECEGRRRGCPAGAAACGARIVQDYSCRGCPRGPVPFVGRVSAGTTRTNGRSTHESVPVVHLRRRG